MSGVGRGKRGGVGVGTGHVGVFAGGCDWRMSSTRSLLVGGFPMVVVF